MIKCYVGMSYCFFSLNCIVFAYAFCVCNLLFVTMGFMKLSCPVLLTKLNYKLKLVSAQQVHFPVFMLICLFIVKQV